MYIPVHQIIVSYHTAQQNRIHCTTLSPPPSPVQHALATLEQIDWCLQQLESVDSAKAMGAPLAQDKFHRLLSRELSNMSEHSKSGNKLAEWVHDITRSANGERERERERPLCFINLYTILHACTPVCQITYLAS